jgi:hypothetical protein
LKELENKLAKVQIAIARFSEMVADPELESVTNLKERLKANIKERDDLQKQIKVETNCVNQKADFPKAALTLFSLFASEKPDLKKSAEWYQNYRRFVQDTNNRKALKNLMPRIFERITLRFTVGETKPPLTQSEIACTFVGGEQVNAKVISSSKGTIIGRNDPKTKKPKLFRLTTSGKKLPVD